MIKNIVFLILSLNCINATNIPKIDPTLCISIFCPAQVAKCVIDSDCFAILNCLQVSIYCYKNGTANSRL